MPPIRLRTALPTVLLPLLAAVVVGAPPDTAAAQRTSSPGAPNGAARARLLDPALLDSAYARAAALPRLRSLLVARDGRLARERYWRGARADRRTNIKSASKSIVSALVGIAIAEGALDSVRQPIASFFPRELGPTAAPQARRITIEDLVSMRAGLQSTSFDGYGAWVRSPDWVRYALTRPVVAEPGGQMLYSTGSSHLLSAILTKATGRSTWSYAQRKLGTPLGITIPRWSRDPQGIYFGGNDMYLSPREMMAFGQLYLDRGRAKGRQVVPAAWIDSSFVVRGYSPWNGHGYGYGWWHRRSGTHDVHFAWGYGGQYIFVVPSLGLVVVATSDAEVASRGGDHLEAIHEMVDRWIVPAAEGR
jgi:CubicO group peptidase (beta-lactamase class C family)